MRFIRLLEEHLSIKVGLGYPNEKPHFESISHRDSGQKCSATSRVYVSSSVWNGGFKAKLLEEVAKIKVGPVTDFGNFLGPVMFVFHPLMVKQILIQVAAADLLMTKSRVTSKKPRMLAVKLLLEVQV